jgi:hypothetical protein
MKFERERNRSSQELIDKNRENDWQDLVAQEKVFLHHWCSSFDLKKSAKTAKLTIAEATRLLKTPLAKAYVDWLTEGMLTGTVLNREWLELQWLENYSRLVGEETIPYVNRDGDMVMVKKYHASEVITALKEMSKLSGMYSESSTGIGTGGVTINFDLSRFGLDRNGRVIDSE